MKQADSMKQNDLQINALEAAGETFRKANWLMDGVEGILASVELNSKVAYRYNLGRNTW
jgi:hypothetical protein